MSLLEYCSKIMWGKRINKQSGVGMIELLVTVFVLSIGILGVASLQFVGTMSNSDALNRSQAAMIAQQLSERLRANSSMSSSGTGLVVDNGYFNDDIYNFENLSCEIDVSKYQCHCLTVPSSIPDCNSVECSEDEFAVFDAYEMSCAIALNSPSIQIDVTCDDNDELDGDTCSAGSRHTILLKWPVENWRNIDRILNQECNVSVSQPHDCVALDVTL
ncbi:MAG: type IV pilus modification protein PilV [Aestuariibacter sp.]